MSEPFFTVAIPTKHRVDCLRDVVRSLIEHTAGDFEVIRSGDLHHFESGDLLEDLAVRRIELQ